MEKISAGQKSRPRSKGGVGWTSSSEKVRGESLQQTGEWNAMGGKPSPMGPIYLPSRAVEPTAVGIFPRDGRNHLLPLRDYSRKSRHEPIHGFVDVGTDGVTKRGEDRFERKRKRRKENLETLKDVYVQLKNLELKILQIMEHQETEELEDLKEQEALEKAQSQALVNETIQNLYQRHVKEKQLCCHRGNKK